MKITWTMHYEDSLCNTPTGCLLQTDTGVVFIPGCHAVQVGEDWYWREIGESDGSFNRRMAQGGD